MSARFTIKPQYFAEQRDLSPSPLKLHEANNTAVRVRRQHQLLPAVPVSAAQSTRGTYVPVPAVPDDSKVLNLGHVGPSPAQLIDVLLNLSSKYLRTEVVVFNHTKFSMY